jgi:F420-dependent oxidoreductase-like protein
MSNNSHSPIFGVFIPQGWKMELAGIEGAEAKWNKSVEIAVLAEELGFDSVWVYDHFHNVPKPSQEAVFECWTTMAAISQRTSSIRLGQMVGCNGYRNPGLLAKITSTLDVISGGRLDWGIGAGWYENEFKGYGYEFPKPSDRIGMLKETIEIVKSMWTQAETTYDGKYYKLSRAQCDPKPLQQPTPPVWIGGGGEQLTLRVVAQHADVSNFGSSIEEFTRKRAILQEHCKVVGRDESTIRKTISSEVFIRETEKELLEVSPRSAWGLSPEEWREKALVGTPEQVSEKIQKYLDAGCTGFVPWCPDYPNTETIELFAKKVIPNFR